jgi:hypothetical protein
MNRFSPGWLRVVFGLVLLVGVGVCAQADEIEGTFRLVKRELPDGTVQTPPTVAGLWTMVNGYRQLNVFWHTPEGKPAWASGLWTYRMTANAYTETVIYFVMDDGSGKPVTSNVSGETKRVVVTRQGGRIAYKLPFDPPSVVFAGDRMTATLEGAFIDYWERVQ